MSDDSREMQNFSGITIHVHLDGTRIIEVMSNDSVDALKEPHKDEEVMLKDLRPGAIFVTREGIYAVKTEYRYGSEVQSQCECILLESGKYAHFKDGNQTLVRQVRIGGKYA